MGRAFLVVGCGRDGERKRRGESDLHIGIDLHRVSCLLFACFSVVFPVEAEVVHGRVTFVVDASAPWAWDDRNGPKYGE